MRFVPPCITTLWHTLCAQQETGGMADMRTRAHCPEIIRLHRHDNDYVVRFLDFHLVNARKQPCGIEDTVFCHFGSHGMLLKRRFRASRIAHKTMEKRCLSMEHPTGPAEKPDLV